jgi:hypothetical protein
MSSCDLDRVLATIEALSVKPRARGSKAMKRMLLPITCAAALALVAPAAFARGGGDDGPGDDHGRDAAALVAKGHDDPPGDDHGGERGRDPQSRSRVSDGVAGVCTLKSTSKLKANPPRNGGIQVEFEVESHVLGQVWSVRLKDKGAAFFTGSATTLAPEGSFELRKLAPNQPGTDVIAASATNRETGETCRATVSV